MFAPSFLIVLVIGTLVLTYDLVQFRRALHRDSKVTARLLARSASLALSMNDHPGAKVILEALTSNEDIRAAGIYNDHGNLFERYPAAGAIGPPPTLEDTSNAKWFSVIAPVQVGAQQLGWLYLETRLTRFNHRAFYFAFGVFAAAVLFSVLAAVFAGYLQGQFSTPVRTLADTARRFTSERDFSIRAPAFEIPEFNDLRMAFNQMLEQIQRQNTALERRTYELSESNRQLLSTNRELEAFTYSVSHDLRTPLRAIASYSQLASSEPGVAAAPEVQNFLARIQKNASKMSQLIDDLLAFSRIDAHELHREDFSAEELVRSIWNQLTEQKDHLELKLENLPPMHADRSLMEQALINLLSNAIKYTRRQEHPIVLICAEQKDGRTVYKISDNGVGFDMRYYSKLFGVFQRLHNEHDFEGTGIGLAIVQRVIARHGGKIWAQSELGKGATFYFTLG